jgi:site-specific DNA-methyltransferase (adenine-specific)
VFPEEIPRRLIKLFTFWGETVLDPFGGTGTTAAAALSLGRSAICIDQNSEFNKLARTRCAAVKTPEGAKARIEKGDARNLEKVRPGSISLVVTSPPYWDKADYGSSKHNVGRRGSYAAFLQDMEQVYRQCFRVLEPGRKICVVTANVNQFTEHGLLTFPIAADTCRILREVGFVMVNEVIWSKDKTGGRWGSANHQRPIFGSYPYPPNFLFKNVHEHILIFAKPNGILRTGEKVRNYQALMGHKTHCDLDETPPSRDRRSAGTRKKR